MTSCIFPLTSLLLSGKTKKIVVEQKFESVHITEHNIETYLVASQVPAIKLNQVHLF